MKWLTFKWGNLKRRWRLAMHGEDKILNAIDGIQTAQGRISYDIPIVGDSDTHVALNYLDSAIAQLKHVIDYHDEPEPVYPDEEHEANGLLHVVPKDFRQQEIA